MTRHQAHPFPYRAEDCAACQADPRPLWLHVAVEAANFVAFLVIIGCVLALMVLLAGWQR